MEVLVWDGDNMNFRRYHESKNLFDKNNADTYPSTNVSTDLSRWAAYEGIAQTVRIPCSANTTYAISIDSAIEQTIFRGLLINTDNVPAIESPVSGTVVISSSDDNTAVFTTLSDTKYIVVQISASVFDDAIDSLMLVAGSQPLPYEPYDSEVWHDIPHYIHNTSTDTITTPADIYANDNNATVGLKGNMEQSGTPTPDSPIQPQECGERTENLIDLEAYLQREGATYTKNGDTFTITMKASLFSNPYYFSEEDTYVSISGIMQILSGSNIRIYIVKRNGEISGSIALGGTSNVRKTENRLGAGIKFDYTSSGICTVENLMLNTGSTALPYEPYGQYKIPILSNSTTTNVYLGKVETTRNIRKLVLNGTENWLVESETNGLFTLPNDTPLIQYNNQLCTHFSLASSYANFYNTDLTFAVVTRPCILIHYNACQTVSAFKAFLASEYAAGHPVTIWYVLPTPQTAVVNEPLRKIGDYVDEVANVSIPTIAGANTLSVETTLQPSGVNVNYKGWHPVVDVHEMNILLAEKPLCSLATGSVPYTDTLNLATGDVSRYIQQYTFDGTENWTAETIPTYTYSIPITAIEDTAGHKSSHFSCKAQTSQLTSGTFGVINGKLMLKYNSATTVDAFKQWLVQQYTNGTPVKMYIINSTPTTEIITVPTGLTGTVNGKFSQSRTPTPSNPLYPTANEVPMWS